MRIKLIHKADKKVTTLIKRFFAFVLVLYVGVPIYRELNEHMPIEDRISLKNLFLKSLFFTLTIIGLIYLIICIFGV